MFGAKKDQIKTFERITLRLSGMRGPWEQEIVREEEKALIAEYMLQFHEGQDERVLQRSRETDVQEVLKVLNSCNITGWNGFYGERPHGLLDGMSFRFEAVVNDGQRITASGTENFPSHYREFTDALYDWLKEKKDVDGKE